MISVSTPDCAGLLAYWRRPKQAAAVAWLLLVCWLPLATSCNYYRTKPVPPAEVGQLADSKLFVVHEGGRTWQLNNPRINGEALEGVQAAVAPDVLPYNTPGQGRNVRYKTKDRKRVLNIVHIYAAEQPTAASSAISIPFTSMQRIELVEKNTGKTVASYVLGGIGIGVGVTVVVGIIALLTKSSCPFIYAHNGYQFQFVGEAYGGAIFAPAERNDYMPLPAIAPLNNQYQLKIANELKERQYTNLAELLLVQHDANTQVLLDSNGQPHTLRAPQAPTTALSGSGQDCTAQLRHPDQNSVLFNDDTPAAEPNSLVLTFDKPRGAQHGKLMLRAQNSLWLDYLYGEFIKKFGSYYNTWADEQKTLPPAVNRDWTAAQSIPLKVYVETSRGWQFVQQIETVGPLAARNLVVPLNLAGIASQGPVRVKLESGFMFWELDYAALDCTPNEPVVTDNCRLLSAVNEAGRDERPNLTADDSQYLQQLGAGTSTTLTFETRLPAPSAGTKRSAFLRTKGYYEHIRHFEGVPNVLELYSFRKPGSFVAFSKACYYQQAQHLHLATAQR